MRFTFVILLFCCLGADAQMIIKAHANYRPYAVAVAQNLLLDDYPNAAAAYSLRKLDKDYAGSAIRVRKDTTGQPEQDIGFLSSGELDTVSLKNFLNARNGFVVTWYDQSGNARNATQATQANQPRIANLGVIDRASSKPTIQFNSHLLQVSFTGIDTSTYFNTFNVINPALAAAANTTSEILWGYAGGGATSTLAERGISWGASTTSISGEKFSMFFSNATLNGGRLGNSTYTRNANTTILHTTINCSNCASSSGSVTGWYVNNELTTRTFDLSFVIIQTTNTSPSNSGTTNTNFWIKSNQGSTNATAQKYSELIIYNNRQSETGRLAGVQNNINSYYSIW
jgi:hypothetical protein